VSGWVQITNSASEPVLLTRRAVCSGGSPTYQTVASGTATNSGWVFLTGTASIPNCTLTELTVYFEGPRTGVILYVDEVSIVRPGGPCETISAQPPLAASLPVSTDWGTGFCVDVQVANQNPVATKNWSAIFNLNGATIYNIWNLTTTATTGQVTVAPTADWSRVIPAEGTSHSLGFCANRPAAGASLPSAPTPAGTF
jgi:cellulase/cellobiase CelA1